MNRKNDVFRDELDARDTDVEFVVVSERLRIGEGEDAFEIIPYPTKHSDDMLVVYFPAIKSLAVADIFNGEMADGLRYFTPGTIKIMAARAAALQEFIKTNELDVESLLAVHGGAVSARELLAYTTPPQMSLSKPESSAR